MGRFSAVSATAVAEFQYPRGGLYTLISVFRPWRWLCNRVQHRSRRFVHERVIVHV
jgi:hypothetical protein